MSGASDWGSGDGWGGGMPSDIVAGVYDRLRHVNSLAKEIEDVPNLLPDMWSMKKIDKKCQEIQHHAQWIEDQVRRFIGTGAG